MDNKLTLKLDSKVIERAKVYARKKNTSLSKLVEGYLQFLTTSNLPEKEEISPLVKSLSGILGPVNIEEPKVAYKKHLTKKYSK